MSKTLSNILTVFKVAKIIAKVIFILCVIGGAGCLIALCMLPLAQIAEVLAEGGIATTSSYPACIAGFATCAGEAVFAYMAERYFGNVLNAGTPFTHDGAKESFRLGLASIIISVAISLVAGLAFAILLLFFPNAASVDVNASISISTGLFFMFMSLIFKHGAELQESAAKETDKEENVIE